MRARARGEAEAKGEAGPERDGDGDEDGARGRRGRAHQGGGPPATGIRPAGVAALPQKRATSRLQVQVVHMVHAEDGGRLLARAVPELDLEKEGKGGKRERMDGERGKEVEEWEHPGRPPSQRREKRREKRETGGGGGGTRARGRASLRL